MKNRRKRKERKNNRGQGERGLGVRRERLVERKKMTKDKKD